MQLQLQLALALACRTQRGKPTNKGLIGCNDNNGRASLANELANFVWDVNTLAHLKSHLKFAIGAIAAIELCALTTNQQTYAD